ncbi:MAG: hypothetical protein V4820_04175 [Pseudomonadota bacterium]
MKYARDSAGPQQAETLQALVTARFTEAPFRAFALSIGQATLAWNDLHEHLGRLYGIILTRGERTAQLAKWQASRRDRQKREMLAAALAEMPFEAPGWTEELRIYVPWILKEVADIEERRNNAVHVPLHIVAKPDTLPIKDRANFIKAGEVRPHDWAHNTRARQMAGKALLAEYRACRDAAVDIRDVVRVIGNCVDRRRRNQLNYAWPRIPPRLLGRAPQDIRDHQDRTPWPAEARKKKRRTTGG